MMRKAAFLIFWGAVLPCFAIQTEVLFIAEKAGETNAFLPVCQKLKEEKRDFRILVFGVARDLVVGYPEERIDVEGEIDVQAIAQESDARVVITGVHSSTQAELLKAFGKKAITYAFWDNFNPNGSSPYFKLAQEVQMCAQRVLFPSRYVAEAPEFKERDPSTKYIVGHPSLEQWQKELEAVDRASILKKLNIPGPITAYIGGYGKEYEAAFDLFTKMPIEGTVIVQVHPQAKGLHFEQERLPQEHFLISSLSTIEAVAIADTIATYHSTVGFQALFMGKRVLFVVPEKDPYTNLAIDKGFAPKVSTADQYRAAMQTPLCKNADFYYEAMGMPKNSIEIFARVVFFNPNR